MLYQENKCPYFIGKKSTAGQVRCQARESSSWHRRISGYSSARGAKFWGILVSHASEGQGEDRLREMNRIKSGVGLGSGHLESVEWPRR
jgi:hypothetical protein